MSGFDDNPFGEVDNPFAVCTFLFFLFVIQDYIQL